MKSSQLNLVTKCLNVFGPINGASILLKLFKCKRGKSGDSLEKLYLKRYDLAVYLRKGTTDWLVFVEVFIDEVYRLDIKAESIDTIIDAGANIGLTTLYYKTMYPSARIISLEPEQNNYSMLVKNVGGNENIIPQQWAVDGINGEVAIIDAGYGNWGFRTGKANNSTVLVPAYTISSIIEKFKIKSIDILKMDIEGAEIEVFNNCPEFLSKTRLLVIELHPDLPGSTSAFLKTLNTYEPLSIRGKGENLIVEYSKG